MAIRLDPNLIIAYYNRGIANGEMGRYDAAIADFSEVIRCQSDFAAAYHDRGIAKSLKGDLESARKDFYKALDIAKSTGNIFLAENAVMQLDELEKHNQD